MRWIFYYESLLWDGSKYSPGTGCDDAIDDYVFDVTSAFKKMHSYYDNNGLHAKSYCRHTLLGCGGVASGGTCEYDYQVCGLKNIPYHPAPLIPLWNKHDEFRELSAAGDIIVPKESQTLYDTYPPELRGTTVAELRYTRQNGGRWHSDEPTMHDELLVAYELSLVPGVVGASSVRALAGRAQRQVSGINR